MAHRTDVTQVPGNYKNDAGSEQVRDPICGKTMDRKTARHVLFRGDETYYFCSKECREQFLHPKKKKAA